MKNRYSMKVSTFALVVASAMMFGLASCQTGVDSVVPAAEGIAGGLAKGGGGQIASAEEIRTANAQLEEIAKAVAVVVADKETATWLHKKCMEKFDGETNVLWKHLDNDSKLRSSAGGGFSERIDALASKRLAANGSVVRSLGGVKAALAQLEKNINGSLHLFWAFPANWDKKTTPLVAFVPFDAEMKTRKSIPAFDAQGNSVIVDEATAKRRPVIVVTVNERADRSGVLTAQVVPQEKSEQQNVSKKRSNTSSQYPTKVELYACTFTAGPSDPWWDGAPEYAYTYSVKSQGGWTNHAIGSNAVNNFFYPNIPSHNTLGGGSGVEFY